MSQKPSIARYQAAAKELFGARVDIPADAIVSYGDDPGAYVEAELTFGVDPDLTDDQWRNRAREEFGRDGELEVDEDDVVKTDTSTIVKCWVWVGSNVAATQKTDPPTPGPGDALKQKALYRCPDCSSIKSFLSAAAPKYKLTCGVCGTALVMKGQAVETIEYATDTSPNQE